MTTLNVFKHDGEIQTELHVDPKCNDGKSWITAYNSVQESIGGKTITRFRIVKLKLEAIYRILKGDGVVFNCEFYNTRVQFVNKTHFMALTYLKNDECINPLVVQKAEYEPMIGSQSYCVDDDK